MFLTTSRHVSCNLNVCIPPNSYVKILFKMWWYLEVRNLGGCYNSHGGELPWMELVPLEVRPQRAPSPRPTMWGSGEQMADSEPESGPSPDPASLASWSWTSQPSERWEINSCCLRASPYPTPSLLFLVQQSEWTDISCFLVSISTYSSWMKILLHVWHQLCEASSQKSHQDLSRALPLSP